MTTQNDKDQPWLMRTYAGHSSPAQTNALYRNNLSKGQTGLSVAFDLPTQTGYDPDHPMSKGEVGRVGVPVAHIGHMRELFNGISLAETNTSMTINATAMWLLAMYEVVAEEQGVQLSQLAGTTQNDIIKEYLSRGTYAFPPQPSLRLTTDLIAHTVSSLPRWNPINVCSYHLQEAGATPVQEIAYALCTAIAVLDSVRDSGQIPKDQFSKVVARTSFFVNSSIRFITELCKIRAFARLWDQLTFERYGVTEPKDRRFRYGVQVNSLGLTHAQPENNVQRIVLEMLGVTLSKTTRARAIQLPAWNEALGLPRPWDQQWSLRMQQVLAHETDLLEYDDIFAGSAVIEKKVNSLMADVQTEMNQIHELGGVISAVETGYLKSQLVASHSVHRSKIESDESLVVGVNCFQSTDTSPLTSDLDSATTQVDPETESAVVAQLHRWRRQCDRMAVDDALTKLRADARSATNLMAATTCCVRAGVTTGEWSAALREVFGEYRAPTGISSSTASQANSQTLQQLQRLVSQTAADMGTDKLRLMIAKPGLDGHSNGAEQIAVRARDAGIEVIYSGIRLSCEQIVMAAVAEDVHCLGLSILSGAHLELAQRTIDLLRNHDMGQVPVVVGGIIPDRDAQQMLENGVSEVFTGRDFALTEIIGRIVNHIRHANSLSYHH